MKKIILSLVAVSCSLLMMAQGTDAENKSVKTQEQFNQELKEFRNETQAYMLSKYVTPVDSTHRLSNAQKSALQYAKKTLKAQKNAIALPLEVNSLLGDTVAPESYIATPVWEEACFLADTVFETTLIIPLKTVTPQGELLSELKVLGADKYTFCRIVTTEVMYTPSEATTFVVVVNSNLDGVMLTTTVFENDELKGQVTGVSDSFGVVDCTYKSNYSCDLKYFYVFHTNRKNSRDYKAEAGLFYKNQLIKSALEIYPNANVTNKKIKRMVL